MIEFQVLNETKQQEKEKITHLDLLYKQYLEMINTSSKDFTKLLNSKLMTQPLLPVKDVYSFPHHSLCYSILVNIKSSKNDELEALLKAREIHDSIEINMKISKLLRDLRRFEEEFNLLINQLKRKLSTKHKNEILERIIEISYQFQLYENVDKIKHYLNRNTVSIDGDTADNEDSEHYMKNYVQNELKRVKMYQSINIPLNEVKPKPNFIVNDFVFHTDLFSSTKMLILQYFTKKCCFIRFNALKGKNKWVEQLIEEIRVESQELKNDTPHLEDSDISAEQEDEKSLSDDKEGEESIEATISRICDKEVEDEESSDSSSISKKRKRTSMRVRKQQLLETEPVENIKPEIKPLFLLNPHLPEIEFNEFGSSFKTPIEFNELTFTTIKMQLMERKKKSLKLKNEICAVKNIKGIEGCNAIIFNTEQGMIDFVNWNDKLDQNEFQMGNEINQIEANYSKEHKSKHLNLASDCTDNSKEEHVPYLIFKVLVFAILHNTELISIEYMEYFIILLDIVIESSDYFKLLVEPAPAFFINNSQQQNAVLSICELILQSLITLEVKNKPELEELLQNQSNPLLIQTRLQLFSFLFTWLDQIDLDIETQTRKSWLKVKHFQFTNNIKNVYFELLNTLDLFKQTKKESIVIKNCINENIIDFERLDKKLKYQKIKYSIDECFTLGESKDYKQIYERTRKFFINNEKCDHGILNEIPHLKRIELLLLLKMGCCSENEKFICDFRAMMILLDLMQSDTFPIQSILRKMDLLLDSIINLTSNAISVVDLEIQNEFGYLCFMLASISWEILEISLDRNQDEQEENKKLNSDFCCKVWILFYKFIKYKFEHEDYDHDSISNELSEILMFVHENLGLVSFCCGANGEFLKLSIHHISKAHQYYHQEIYQNYNCLFGTLVTLSQTQTLSDHHTVKSEFGQEAAELMFEFIQPGLQDKLESFNLKQIPRDYRTCLEMISQVYSELPDTRNILLIQPLQKLILHQSKSVY
jgi:hypothetical protein